MEKKKIEKASKKALRAKAGFNPLQVQFAEVAALIHENRGKANSAVNAVMIETYWKIGQYISHKVDAAEWGQGVVKDLSDYLLKSIADPRGFSARNLWRMKQFFEAYHDNAKVSPLVTQIQWTNHLIILSSAQSIEAREFYLKLCIDESYSKRNLQQVVESHLFERQTTKKPKVSPALTQFHPEISNIIRDSYSLAFLGHEFFNLSVREMQAEYRSKE